MECSTPEGIEGGRTFASRPAPPSDRSAQRPRASKGVARTMSGGPSRQSMCSTPEGIEGGRTPSPLQGGFVFGRVLNARGHRRGSHSVPVRSAARAAGGAQRPRASKGVAHELRSIDDVRTACSTPEGIEGGRTRSLKGLPLAPVRCSTPEGIEGGRTPRRNPCSIRVFVLNARGHRRGSHRQRARQRKPALHVLNARGHRRGSHGIGVVDRGTSRRVLNARGHRRGSHPRPR